MKREKIEEQFKWKDSDLYNSSEEFFADCERIKLLLRKVAGFKGRLNNEKDILKFLKLQVEVERKLERVIIYAYIKKSVEGADAKNIELGQASQDVSVKASMAMAFFEEEISKLSTEQILELANNPEFADFKRDLEFLVKNKPHVMPENIEKIVSGVGAFADFEDTFSTLSNIEMPIHDIVLKNGKHLPLNNSNFSKYMHSADREVRKQAYLNFYQAYKNFNITYSNTYINSLKYENFLVKTYNFKSNFERVNFYEEVPENLLSILLENVHKVLKLIQRLQKIKAKALKIDEFKYYDMFAPFTNSEPKFPLEKGIEAIISSLDVIGDDYIEMVKNALKLRWVDLYPSKNKDSCSYCISCYDVHPYILTNYNNTLESVSTLSHELGHAMQSFFASKEQSYNLFETPSLTCEIASTVNEILTKKYLIDNAKTKAEKLIAIDSLLGDFYGAIYKQSLYTEFEIFANSQIEAGEALTFDKLNNKYKELIKIYFGESCASTKNCECEWSRLPHLYSPFYVYKYVVGFVSACIICGKLLSGDKSYKQKYMQFLKAGRSKSPLELLKLAEVDLLDKCSYSQTFKLFELYINELEELLEEN